MSNMQARVTSSDRAFHVEGYEKIEYDLLYVDGIFAPDQEALADCYRPYGRVLMVVDESVYGLYGEQIRAYFDHHGLTLTVIPVQIRETAKSLETFERIVSEFDAYGLVRTEPVLVVGGGLTTDVAGFACASYRRNTPYIRIPTTLIGLIDASVSIKVAVNHGKHKNRLGAYHASQKVFLDFSFLRTLPEDQVRNGMAELIKIAVVGNAEIFGLLEGHGADLLRTRFGHLDGTEELRQVGDRLTYQAIATMLDLEAPNLRDRPGSGDRIRSHVESHIGTHAAGAVLPRPCDQHRHGAVDHARRTARPHLGHRPRPGAQRDERTRPGTRQ